MSDVTIRPKTKCPICFQGWLVPAGREVWQCSRPACDNEFFYDTDRTLNVRDKPPRTLFPQPACQCPPPFIPQQNGTCGVCARPPVATHGRLGWDWGLFWLPVVVLGLAFLLFGCATTPKPCYQKSPTCVGCGDPPPPQWVCP